LQDPIKEQYFSIATQGDTPQSYGEKKGTRIGGEISKAFDTPVYFSVFPLSLRRIAPKLIFNHYSRRYSKGEIIGRRMSKDCQEYGVGIDNEILALHLTPIHLEFDWLRTEKQSPVIRAQISLSQTF
jgi:hypothetical protein